MEDIIPNAVLSHGICPNLVQSRGQRDRAFSKGKKQTRANKYYYGSFFPS